MMNLTIDEACAYASFPGQPSASDAHEVPVDGGKIWVRRLSESNDPLLAQRMARFLEGVRASFQLPRGPRLPLSALLIVSFREDELWLFRQLLFQVAEAIDTIALERNWSSNPLNASDLPGTRYNAAVVEKLALGEGRASSSRALLPAAHVESYNALQPSRFRRWGICKSLVMRSSEAILLQYEDVGRTFLRECDVVSVAVDASRVGRREVLVLVLVGLKPSGEFMGVLAAPQVSSCFLVWVA